MKADRPTKPRAPQQGQSAPASPAGHSSAASAAHASASSHAAGPEAILRAIENSVRARSAPDARRATRYHYCVPMTLYIDDPRARSTRLIRAATSNISTGGFAFIFDAALSVGSTIRAQFDSLPGKPEIAGVVRSCAHICGTQHRIGVEYQ